MDFHQLNSKKPKSLELALTFMGDVLDPDAVSRQLGATPNSAWKKGEEKGAPFSDGAIAETGIWSIEISSENTIEEALAVLFDKLSSNLSLWDSVSRQATGTLVIQINQSAWNMVLGLSKEVLSQISARQLELQLNVYQEKASN